MDCFRIGKIVSNNPHSAYWFFNFLNTCVTGEKSKKTVYLWMLFEMFQSIVMDDKDVITISYDGEIVMKK